MKKNNKKILIGLFFLTLIIPLAASAQPTTSSVEFTNPLAFDTVEELLSNVLSRLRGIIVILSIIFMVIGAILYITSAGNDGRMKTAKGAITAAMIGLAIGIAAPSFLREISDILGWNGSGLEDEPTLSRIALNVLNFLLGIVGTLALIMLVVGAIMYFGAGADEKSVEKGKAIVKYSLIGITVALASLTVVKQIANLLTA